MEHNFTLMREGMENMKLIKASAETLSAMVKDIREMSEQLDTLAK